MILLECPQEVSQNKAKDKRFHDGERYNYACRFSGVGGCRPHTVLHGGPPAASEGMYNFVD